MGLALRAELGGSPQFEYATRSDLDVTSPDFSRARRWRDYGTIINAAAYTSVDAAETPNGRRDAWEVNVAGATALARIATANGISLVHISSDYVFDGSSEHAYAEDDPLCPLSVYGQTKAAADIAVATVPRHYIVRTSWVVGDGNNFVRTMASLAAQGISPKVVDDQIGRLTFTADLARGIAHLIRTRAPFGVYNLTSAGKPASWTEVAREVFELTGHDPSRVIGVSTAEYFSAATNPVAPGQPGAPLI